MSERKIRTTPLDPFGLRVTASPPNGELLSISANQLRRWIDRHHLVVLREFLVPSDVRLVSYCQQLGELMRWDFGVINELRVQADAANYLYTNRAVPFHWDGAFAGIIPHYIFFHCRIAPPPEAGGETLFCDTTRVLQRLSADEIEAWQRISVTYSTEKVVHYGGTFSSPLIAHHPQSGETVIRFAEPVEDLNPVCLEFDGLPAEDCEALMQRLRDLLRDRETCYRHVWHNADVVIADNHLLLHGRNAFAQPATRHLRRINVL